MKKLKLIISGALVAVCAFMMAGCGQLNAKQAVTESITVSQSIGDTAGSMSDARLSNSATNMASSFVDDYSEYLAKIETFSKNISAKCEDILNKLTQFQEELAKLQANKDAFVEKYENLEIAEEDVATLNEQLNVLKDVKKNIENDYKTLKNKITQAQQNMQNIDITSFNQNTINSIVENIETTLNNVVELLNKGIGYVQTSTQAMATINEVILKYIA